MGETLRIYLQLIGAQGRAQASYRVSFWLDLAGNAIVVGADLLTVLVIYTQVPKLGGFGVAQTLVFFGLALAAFSLADLFVGNIERMKTYVRMGTLDGVLVRPLGVLPQLLAMDVGFRRLGRVAYALVIFAVSLSYADIPWTPSRVVLAVVAPLSGAVFFCAYFVATATVAFWWVESGELANALTYGGRDFTSYPITVYSGWFRKLFAFGLGFGFVAYYPGLALLGIPDPLGFPSWLGWGSVLVALIAVMVAATIWRTGVRHYRSTGS
ncbi:ABC transporter permease [Catelliglobosispora koreensis]|uniref:ABC transporter permease n=1 Tax=Catelliglobosispora koreensis TaxID=129052 RepID=UPI000372FBAE|nr:ABC-2 family transporter protein [Catelliglobosispora koreensis]